MKECENEAGTACVFPFKDEGEIFNACRTSKYNDARDNKWNVATWCSTHTDRNGNHVLNSAKLCGNCPRSSEGITLSFKIPDS